MKAVLEGMAMLVRPNWIDLKAYAVIERASLSRIAWEFLRRNPDYQKAFAEYVKRVRACAGADSELAKYIELWLTPNPREDLLDGVWSESVRHDLATRFHGRFFAAEKGTTGRLSPLDRQHGKAWGVEGMPHPAEEYSMQKFAFLKRGNSITMPTSDSLRELENKEMRGGTFFDSKWLILQVDLSLPLQVIEAVVLSTIKAHRSLRVGKKAFSPVNNRALPKARYLEYLRILDGLDAGISIMKIGEKLAPDAMNAAPERQRDKRFRAAKVEAERLQREGYRVLPMLQMMNSMRKKK